MSDTKSSPLQIAIKAAIASAIAKGIHTGDRVLLLLTETDPNSGYGYQPGDISHPHTTDGDLIMSIGENKQGQKQFLISFDPINCDEPINDEPLHVDPSVPAGWDWKIYGELTPPEIQPILIVLTRTAKIESSADQPEEIKGFSLLRVPSVADYEQYAILIDPDVFTVQIRST